MTLAEFRGHYRAVQRSGWYVLFPNWHQRTKAERRAASVMAVMAIAAPVSWHVAHPGRLDGRHRERINQWLTIWRPLYRRPIAGIHPEAK